MTRHRLFAHLAARLEKIKAESVDITPVGMFNRDAWIGENPKFFIRIPPNVMRPVQMLDSIPPTGEYKTGIYLR